MTPPVRRRGPLAPRLPRPCTRGHFDVMCCMTYQNGTSCFTPYSSKPHDGPRRRGRCPPPPQRGTGREGMVRVVRPSPPLSQVGRPHRLRLCLHHPHLLRLPCFVHFCCRQRCILSITPSKRISSSPPPSTRFARRCWPRWRTARGWSPHRFSRRYGRKDSGGTGVPRHRVLPFRRHGMYILARCPRCVRAREWCFFETRAIGKGRCREEGVGGV